MQRSLVLMVIAVASLARPSSAQTRSLLPPGDLAGWRVDVPARDTAPRLASPFRMVGALLQIAGEPRGHLITDAEYRDYRLVVEYRFPGTPGNAGVLIHASRPRALYSMFPQSIEVQMESGNAGDFWCIVEDITVPDMLRRRGPRAEWGVTEGKGRRITRLPAARERPMGEWNRLEIEAVGRTITVRLNGTLVNGGTTATADHGRIAVQSEGAAVDIRRLDLIPVQTRRR